MPTTPEIVVKKIQKRANLLFYLTITADVTNCKLPAHLYKENSNLADRKGASRDTCT